MFGQRLSRCFIFTVKEAFSQQSTRFVTKLTGTRGRYFMNKFNRKISIWTALAFLIATTPFPPAVAMQGDVWGPWTKTRCKDTPINSPLGGRNIAQPQIAIPGREKSQVCQWERKKNECPKLSSKLKKPVKCFFRYDKSSNWSQNPPPN